MRGGDGDMDNVHRQRRRHVCLAVKERGSDNVSGRGGDTRGVLKKNIEIKTLSHNQT